jgi:DNA-binding MurR/RpiR family transcriptional regulator
MPKVKLYASKAWLTRKYEVEKRSEKEIAELAGTTVMTINRYLHKYGLKKDR